MLCNWLLWWLEIKTKKVIPSINGCECEFDNWFSCPFLAPNAVLFNKCKENFYKIENDALTVGEYFICYKDPKDKNDSLYKSCYYTCEECEIKGNNINHNYLECNLNFPFEINITKYKNCYINSSYYYNDNYFYSTEIIQDTKESTHIESETKENTDIV